jgi:hypothetical protein
MSGVWLHEHYPVARTMDMCILWLCQDTFILMGWDVESLKLAGFPESKLCGLIGEGLHLGCVGLVLCLIFALPQAPWWDPLSVKLRTDALAPQLAAPAQAAARAPKRQRRLGLIRRASLP